MPPVLFFDLSKIDLQAEPVFTRADIEKENPQRYEMEQLDGILWYEKETRMVLGYRDIRDTDFWVRGHIPERPLMPGVIMIEAAAQLLSFYVKHVFGVEGFIGFTSIESARFRAPAAPGDRLLLLGHITSIKSRKFSADIQGVVGDRMIFETSVSGMKV
ncbi:MAG: 3-hydroxyacyl-ACP dehydratase FabZ family protein [Phycisphaerae bacterium]|jgi:3-hydroxyacyl-[acyl-carrier-protein] dehydratase